MGKAAAARKLASAAAFGGGGLSVLGAGLYGVLTAEAKLARRAIGNAKGRPPDATGWYGRGRPGPAIKVALLGDSSAAGYGVHRVEEVPGAILASGLAERANRRVYLREYAAVGAQSSDLERQVDRALPIEPDVAVILVGANDVTHTVLPSQAVRHLGEAVRRLRERDVAVLVGTCPTSARSSRSRRRSSRSPGPGRAGWRPPRRSRLSRPAAGRCPWARSLGPSSPRRPRSCSGRTGSIPPPAATRHWPASCSRRRSPHLA